MPQYWKPESKANSTNPKDLLGNAKVSYSKVPAIAVAYCAMAMMDGAEKYGAYNWRDKDVIASIYVDAAKRHLDCWFEGQKSASDSKVHHLGHAMACCAILLDAEAKGKLVDDRPLDDADLDFMEKQLAAMSETIKRKREEKAEAQQRELARQVQGLTYGDGTTIIDTPNSPLVPGATITTTPNIATPQTVVFTPNLIQTGKIA